MHDQRATAVQPDRLGDGFIAPVTEDLERGRCGQGRRDRDGHQATMHRYLTMVAGELLAYLFPVSTARCGRFKLSRARRPGRGWIASGRVLGEDRSTKTGRRHS